MKLLTYKTQDTEPRLGFIHNNQVIDMEDFGEISNFPLPNAMLDLIDMGFEIIAEITEIISETPENFFEEISYDMDEVTILAPIEKPRKNIIGIGLNYTEHVAESARTLDTTGKLPQKPIIFSISSLLNSLTLLLGSISNILHIAFEIVNETPLT